MSKLRFFLVLFTVVLVPVTSVSVCFAQPSSNFYQEDGNIFDDWHVCRTDACGENGFLQIKETETGAEFRPLIPFESVGEYTDTAYEMGEQFVKKYPDRNQRAEKIFEYVRDRVQYTPDIDQWDMNDYAQNADEVANIIQKEGLAYGDCEEFAILLAVMYQGAGFRSAIIICPGHSAILLHLPGYEGANQVFSLEGEAGWIWAEATGNTNPFGWFPEGQVEEPILGYEISSEEHIPLWQPPEEETPQSLNLN